MNTLEVTVKRSNGMSTEKQLHVTRIANLGLAGRNQSLSQVTGHVQQMNEVGVETPSELPFITPKPKHLLTTADVIEVNSGETAGEAEFVLFPTSDGVYVGVGNDHKDIALAAEQMHLANSTCPSVVSDTVWRLDDIREHWDGIRLQSWVESNGTLEPYQQAQLDEFLKPDTILKKVGDRISKPVEGTAIWSGTVGTDGVDPFPDLVSGTGYLVRLYDAILDRQLTTQYRVQPADWIPEVNIDRE